MSAEESFRDLQDVLDAPPAALPQALAGARGPGVLAAQVASNGVDSVAEAFRNVAAAAPAYAWAFLYDQVRCDSALYSVAAVLKSELDNAARTGSTQLELACAAYLSAGVLARARRTPSSASSSSSCSSSLHDDVTDATRRVLENRNLSGAARLEIIANLLKNPQLHPSVLAAQPTDSILCELGGGGDQGRYKALFCLSLVAAAPERCAAAESLLRNDQLPGLLVRVLQSASKAEKVVRMGLQLVRQLADGGHAAAMDAALELSLLAAVRALEYDKYRDAALYAEIKDVADVVHREQTARSSFERYAAQVAGGVLVDGFLHTEQFWARNVLKFEKNDFGVIRELAALVASTDYETKIVALNDLGEFARLHPQGKLVTRRMHIKEKAIALLECPERRVARAALHCVQRLMLNRAHTDAL